MSATFTAIKETIAYLCGRIAENRDKQERRVIAMHFNNLYAYRKPFLKPPRIADYKGADLPQPTSETGLGYAWMCPECNTIHGVTGINAMTGFQYPKCCSYPAGSRWNYDNIKTKP